MIIKVMERAQGGFKLIEVVECLFRRFPNPHLIYRITGEGPREYRQLTLTENAYVLDKNGDTVETFNANLGRKVGT